MKRNEAKKLKRNEAKNYCFCFAKRSEKEAKRFLFRFVSLQSEKKIKAKMGHPRRLAENGHLALMSGRNIVLFYRATVRIGNDTREKWHLGPIPWARSGSPSLIFRVHVFREHWNTVLTLYHWSWSTRHLGVSPRIQPVYHGNPRNRLASCSCWQKNGR